MAGTVNFNDNANVLLQNFNQGTYTGSINATTGAASGQYFETDQGVQVSNTFNWTATRQ
ncbi:MAG: hypothetical protein R3E58_16340 [Phycisphaerae bacterium]